MTTEFVLILGLYAFILMGVFFGDHGPKGTFDKSAPRLAAILERDMAAGKEFHNAEDGQPFINWLDPKKGAP